MIGCFVTGTDTGVGKTLVSTGLLHALAPHHRRVVGMKPVAAGVVPWGEDWASEDAIALRSASTLAVAPELDNPVLLLDPLSPHIAAERAGVQIDIAAIVRSYQALAAQADAVMVEGAGGWGWGGGSGGDRDRNRRDRGGRVDRGRDRRSGGGDPCYLNDWYNDDVCDSVCHLFDTACGRLLFLNLCLVQDCNRCRYVAERYIRAAGAQHCHRRQNRAHAAAAGDFDDCDGVWCQEAIGQTGIFQHLPQGCSGRHRTCHRLRLETLKHCAWD